MMCWHILAALLVFVPAWVNAPGSLFSGDKGRFTAQRQNQSIPTPSVILTPSLMLSLHPLAQAVIDFSQHGSLSVTYRLAESHKSSKCRPSGVLREIQAWGRAFSQMSLFTVSLSVLWQFSEAPTDPQHPFTKFKAPFTPPAWVFPILRTTQPPTNTCLWSPSIAPYNAVPWRLSPTPHGYPISRGPTKSLSGWSPPPIPTLTQPNPAPLSLGSEVRGEPRQCVGNVLCRVLRRAT